MQNQNEIGIFTWKVVEYFLLHFFSFHLQQFLETADSDAVFSETQQLRPIFLHFEIQRRLSAKLYFHPRSKDNKLMILFTISMDSVVKFLLFPKLPFISVQNQVDSLVLWFDL